MLLLFAGGVMNVLVIAALTAFVAFEAGTARSSGRPRALATDPALLDWAPDR